MGGVWDDFEPWIGGSAWPNGMQRLASMPPNGAAMTKRQVRSTWKGYSATSAAVLELLSAGWTVVKQSKHYRAYCPCNTVDFSISGTPRVDKYEATKIRQNASKCPDSHESILSRRGRPGPRS